MEIVRKMKHANRRLEQVKHSFRHGFMVAYVHLEQVKHFSRHGFMVTYVKELEVPLRMNRSIQVR